MGTLDHVKAKTQDDSISHKRITLDDDALGTGHRVTNAKVPGRQVSSLTRTMGIEASGLELENRQMIKKSTRSVERFNKRIANA